MSLDVLSIIFLLILGYYVNGNEDDTPKLYEGCPRQKILKTMDDSKFYGRWYLMLASKNSPSKCTVFNATETSSHHYETKGKGIYLNGTKFDMKFLWAVKNSTEDQGVILDIQNGYSPYNRLVMYNLDLDSKGALTIYMCWKNENEKNGIEETIQVYTRELSYNESSIGKVIASHNLTRIPLEKYFSNCPSEYINY